MSRFDWSIHHPGPLARMPNRSYLVVAAPRTGTSQLCALLRVDRCFGRPEEYFDRAQVHAYAARWRTSDPWTGGDARRYVERMLLVGTTWNRVFGAKLLTHSIDDALDLLGIEVSGPQPELGLYDRLPGLGLVHLQRRDKVKAAVSLWRAEQTGQWKRWRWQSNHQVDTAIDIDFVTSRHQANHEVDRRWQAVLATGAPGVSLDFDELVADPDHAVEAVGNLMKVRWLPKLHRAAKHVLLQTQSDELSERLVQQWVEATGGCPECGYR